MNKQDRQTALWLITFLLLSVLFYWINSSPWFEAAVIDNLARFHATAAARGLSLLGLSLAQEGSTIIGATGPVEVAGSCTGTLVFLLFSAAVLPFPAPWKMRITALALGALLLFAVNLLRISLIVFVVSRFPGALWTLHVVVGQVLVIAAMITFFLWWTKRSETGIFFSLTRSRRAMARGVSLFVLGYLAGYWLYGLFLQSTAGAQIQYVVGRHALWLIDAMNRAAGSRIEAFAAAPVDLVEGCLASPMPVFLAALVLSWPAAWWKRLLVILAGFLPLFYLYHLLRAVLIAATLGFQGKGENLVYHLYGQLVLGLVLLIAVAFHLRHRAGIRMAARLAAGLAAGLVAALVAGFLSRNLLIPALGGILTETGALSYNPQQSVSRMPDLQAFCWTCLMVITPYWGRMGKAFAVAAGILGVFLILAAVVALIEVFRLTPHVGLFKLGAVLLPFLLYIPFLTGKGRSIPSHAGDSA
jgi:exosortase/archaeosortase family protein